MISLEEFQQATGISPLTVNERGQIRFKPGLTLTDRKRFLKQALAAYRKQDKIWRFLLGDMVNDLRLPSGQKKAYCRDAFGEQAGITIYGYSLTAAYWDDDKRDSAAPWSLYKESAQLPIAERNAVIQRFVRREIDLPKAFGLCREWKAANMPRSSTGTGNDLKIGQKPHSSTLVQSNTNSVELAPALQAIHCAVSRAVLGELRQAIARRWEELQDDETDEFAEE